MRLTLTQSDAGLLVRVAARFGRGAMQKAIEKVKKRLAETALTELHNGFKASRDPYGNPWQELASGDESRLILIKSGLLRNSYSARATSGGFEIGTEVKYALTHQFGRTVEPHKRSYKLKAHKRVSSKGKKYRVPAQEVQVEVKKAYHIPARPMLPYEGKGLGTWQKPLEDTIERTLMPLFKGVLRG